MSLDSEHFGHEPLLFRYFEKLASSSQSFKKITYRIGIFLKGNLL